MLVVLDTNVIVSATLSRSGAPAELVRRWRNKAFEVATSPQQWEEIERTFTYPRVQKALKLSPGELEEFFGFFRSNAVLVEPSITLYIIPEDPDDNRIVECAVAAGASYIVSGNTKHLGKLGSYEGIRILEPPQFLALLDVEGQERSNL